MASAKQVRAGNALIMIGAKLDIEGTLRKGEKRLKAFGKSVGSIGSALAKFGGAGAAGIAATALAFAKAGDQIDKMAARTGASAESLSELGFAAEQSGTSITAVEKGMRGMARTLLDAERGSAEAVDSLDDLGISLEAMRALSPDEQLAAVADALQGIEDPSKRSALALKVLGRSGSELMPLLAGGSEAMNTLREEARALGLTIDGETARSAAELTDAMNRLKRSVLATVVRVGAAVGPMLTDVADYLARIVPRIQAWVRDNAGLIRSVAKLVGGVFALGVALIAVGKAIGIVGSLLGVAANLVGFLLSPIGLLITGVVGLAGAFVYLSGSAGDVLEWLGSAFQWLRDRALKMLGGIANALKAGNLALAAKIGWLGIQSAFLEAISPLKRWWNELLTGLTAAWAYAVSFISNVWVNLVTTIRNVWNRVIGYVAKRLIDIQYLVTDMTAEQRDALKAAVDEDTSSKVADAEAARSARVAEIRAELEAGLVGAVDREGERQSEVDRKLEDTKRRYADALQQASREAKDTAERDLKRRAATTGDYADEAGSVAAEVLGSRSSARGTFNALGAASLAGGGIQQKIADSAQKTQRAVDRIARDLESGRAGLVFE